MILPSKELLSEVLGEDVKNISISCGYSGNIVKYTIENYETEEDGELIYIDLGTNINIYELMHLMKEWIIKTARPNCVFSTFNSTSLNGYGAVINDEKQFFGRTEFEAVVKACEWLLKNKE